MKSSRLNTVRTVLVVVLAAATVLLISAPGDGLRAVRSVGAAGQATARGAVMHYGVRSGTIRWSNGTMQNATGTWQGPPERVYGPFQVTASHGNTLYYWYVRGIAGAKPADEKTMVLATDNWRFQTTSYDRTTDTISFPNGLGQTTRRQGTPVWGVVAVQAPSISEQASDPASIRQHPASADSGAADGSTWTMNRTYKPNRDWVARTVELRFGSNTREVTGEPTGANSDAVGRVWEGVSNPGAEDPTVTGNALLSGRPYQGTFVITVPCVYGGSAETRGLPGGHAFSNANDGHPAARRSLNRPRNAPCVWRADRIDREFLHGDYVPDGGRGLHCRSARPNAPGPSVCYPLCAG
ncbi:MAG: hypothetical protein IPF82_09340 [Blastocatellia bacterium]|nr:hypothetical protein [Blastocatellia bacterium]